MKDFKLIVLSNPTPVVSETEIFQSLFDEGLEILHLRKPGYTISGFEKCISNIPVEYYSRIVIHSHYELAEKYNLKGIHITNAFLESNPVGKAIELRNKARQNHYTVSRSVHSIEELEQLEPWYDYVFFGPVFDSISKKNYKSQVNLTEIKKILFSRTHNTKIIALGGISPDNIKKIIHAGFNGAAVLGAIWNDKKYIETFKKFKITLLAMNW
ncbi:MAG: thiamine phosphate synthase [Bacteroidia bacterium]|nr:thiamine phosphate synthase [Bacteroidia bacterium]